MSDASEVDKLVDNMGATPWVPSLPSPGIRLPFDGRLSAEEQRMIDEGQLGAFRSDTARRA